MSDRAPDGQPTSNIRLVLANEQARLDYWERVKDLDARALTTAINAAARSRQTVAQWEKYLEIRLAEEAAAGVEVTGL